MKDKMVGAYGRIWKRRRADRVLVREHEGNIPLGRYNRRWEEYNGRTWNGIMVQERDKSLAVVNTVMNPKGS
jgi:hypothetical protein